MASVEEAEQKIQERFGIRRRGGYPISIRRGNRDVLAEVFGELGYNKGAEIGVARGVYSEILCKANPQLQMVCVDPWETLKGLDRKSARILATQYIQTKERLAGLNCDIRKVTSQEAVGGVLDGSLDFVFIDGAHTFDATMHDLLFWTKKVKVGGIVAGHDLCMAWRGVVEAVEAYTRGHSIMPWYCIDEMVPTYFWVQKQSYLEIS